MIDLNALLPTGSGWQLFEAYGINDSGQITGYGYINGGSDKIAFSDDPSPRTRHAFAAWIGRNAFAQAQKVLSF